MRKIESEMVHNVMMGRDWSKANTSTNRAPEYMAGWLTNSAIEVRLHDNHIATVYRACDGRNRWYVEVNTRTLSDYPTRTTMSRLRALGVDVCTRKGRVILDGNDICQAY
jgi:hypothetical protein